MNDDNIAELVSVLNPRLKEFEASYLSSITTVAVWVLSERCKGYDQSNSSLVTDSINIVFKFLEQIVNTYDLLLSWKKAGKIGAWETKLYLS